MYNNVMLKFEWVFYGEFVSLPLQGPNKWIFSMIYAENENVKTEVRSKSIQLQHVFVSIIATKLGFHRKCLTGLCRSAKKRGGVWGGGVTPKFSYTRLFERLCDFPD